MKTLIKILCLSMLWFSCESSTEPEENNNHIRGYVYNNSGEPLENTAIFLTYEIIPIDRPNTTISFSIPEAGPVSVWITDFCGDLVKTLIDNEMYDAGTYSVTWDTRDNNDNVIVHGSYTVYINLNGSEISMNTFYNSIDYNWIMNESNPESWNSHDLTNEEGYFSIPIECLSFGVTQTMTDGNGNYLGEFIVPYTIKLSVYHENYGVYATDFYEVNPETGLNIDITFP